MSSSKQKKKTGSDVDYPIANAPQVLDVAAWARQCLSAAAAANEISDEEITTLEAQWKSLATVKFTSTPLPPDPTAPIIIRDRKSLRQVAAKLKDAPEVAIDLETSTLNPFDGEIVGVGLAVADTNYYIPTGHRFAADKKLRPDQLSVDVVAKELRLDQLPLVAHNAKFELRWLRRHAGVTCVFIWDVMIAARLLAAHLPADLKELAMSALDVPDWSLTKEEITTIQFQPIERVARYCAKDCRYTLELFWSQRKCLN